MNIMNFPGLVLILSFGILVLAARVGTYLRQRRHITLEDTREDFNTVRGATLTLLGLIIGFTFSMAISRYDQRKVYEEEEANAIGTEYLRVGLLPAADAARARALLITYLDQRIQFYEARNPSRIRQINAATTQTQD